MSRNSYAKPPYSPTRFPAGITNANDGETLGNFGAPDPTKFHTLFDDFNFGVSGWTAVTTAAVAGAGGLVTITAAGSLVTPQTSFRVDLTRRFFMKARVSQVNIVTGTVLFGLVDAIAAPTRGLYLTLVNSVLTLNLVGAGGTTTVAATVVTSNTTFNTIGIEYNPVTHKVMFYFNNAAVGGTSTLTNLVTAQDLALGIKSTTTDASVDYVLAAAER